MHSYLLDVGYELPEYVHIIPRDTIPLVVVVVVLGLYVPVLSGNVGEVDIVKRSCQNLVILSVHMSTVLYYLHSTTAYIEFIYNARTIDDHICVRTYSMYVHAYSTNAYVDICLKRIIIYFYVYTNIIVSCACMRLSHLLPFPCTAHLVSKPVLD